MTPPVPRNRPLSASIAILALGATLCGCFNPFSPRIGFERGVSVPAPVPSTPAGALRLLEWCYNNRNAVVYREIFTEDYRFVFSKLDSTGNQYTDATPWTRDDELISTTQLFEGGSESGSPASSTFLQFDPRIIVYSDARPGKNGTWHKQIRTNVLLNIRTADGNAIDITGSATFFLARGDSALIPQELKDRGFGSDPNRWYIERWEDETVQLGVAALTASEASGTVAGGRPFRSGPGPIGYSARRLPLIRNRVTAQAAMVPATDVKQPGLRASDDLAVTATWGWLKALYRLP